MPNERHDGAAIQPQESAFPSIAYAEALNEHVNYSAFQLAAISSGSL